MYADFDSRYRPRPLRWRLALISLAHFLLGATITNGLVSFADVVVLRAAPNMPDAWVVYATPWLTLKAVMPRIVKAYDFTTPLLIATGSLLLVALVAVYLWPARQSIASRAWAVTFGQTLAAFGGAIFPFRSPDPMPPMFYAAPVIAAVICMAGEWSTNTILGGYYDLESPLQRAGMWAVRILPGTLVLAGLSYGAGYMYGVLAAGALAVVTLFANLMKKPGRALEKMRNIEIREAAAAMPLIAAVVVAGAFFVFGYRPAYGIVIKGSHVTREPLAAAMKAIEPPEPVIDIHWSKPRRQTGRQQTAGER